jgi:hypothetical protein
MSKSKTQEAKILENWSPSSSFVEDSLRLLSKSDWKFAPPHLFSFWWKYQLLLPNSGKRTSFRPLLIHQPSMKPNEKHHVNVKLFSIDRISELEFLKNFFKLFSEISDERVKKRGKDFVPPRVMWPTGISDMFERCFI